MELGDATLHRSNTEQFRSVTAFCNCLTRLRNLFAGSDTGGKRAATIYTILQTAALNGLDPEAYLSDILARIADHPINRVEELLPWNWAAKSTANGSTQKAA